jgi:hypothetical protein
VCVCVSGVWTVHCVGYGEIVWYMQLNVLCVTVSLSVCVVGVLLVQYCVRVCVCVC